ncbi:MAG: hypothetical protein F6K39_23555, partial [Okeania sp. SIO3B3]|nr:hypothetical protein [Okeania sp. SIO3B3]
EISDAVTQGELEETNRHPSVEKRSLQNNGVKGLQDLAQLLENSQTGTEILPTSAGNIPQESAETKSHFLSQDYDSQNLLDQQVLNLEGDDIVIEAKEQRNKLDQNQRIDGASRKNLRLGDNSLPKLGDRLDFIDEQEIKAEIELDVVIEALTQEINQEYRRFYGH